MLVRHRLLALLGDQALLLLLRQPQLAITLHRFALLVVAALEIALVESTLLLGTIFLTMLVRELLLAHATLLRSLLLLHGALLRSLLGGTRRHGLALIVTSGGHVLLLAIARSGLLRLCRTLLRDLLLVGALLVKLTLADVLGMLGLLLATCLRLLGDPLPLRGLLLGVALHHGLALLGTMLGGGTLLRGGLLRTLRGFTTHRGLLLARLGGLGLTGGSTLLASLRLRLCFFGLLFTAVLLVVTP